MRLRRYFPFFLFVLFCNVLAAQQEGQSFQYLSAENGLSNNWVKSILKDKDGFMWFGTFNGLNRYNGREFRIFHADTISRLNDNIIECLTEDKQGNIWVGTFSEGLHRYEKNTETFTSFQNDPSRSNSISGNRINSLLCDASGHLWIGTDAGLDRFDPSSSSFVHYKVPGNSFISTIYQDHEGVIWIGTQNGLNRLNEDDRTFTHYPSDPLISQSLSHGYVKGIYEDKYGALWIATWGGGLNKLNKQTQTFQRFTTVNSGLNNNSILSICGDDEDHLFLATEGGGLNVLNIHSNKFTHFLPDLLQTGDISSNSVHTVMYDDETGMIWVGTYNGGVNYFSKWDKPFTRFQARLNGLNNNHITSFAEDRNGNLWIGTDGGGVNVLDPEFKIFTHYNSNSGLLSNAVLALMYDNRNRVWIGSYNGGVDLMENGRIIQQFTHLENDESTLSASDINSIYQDKRGNIWIGTMSGGLNLYNPVENSFKRYIHDSANDHSILDNFIYDIFEDRLGRLLVLTGKGVEVYDYKTNDFSRYVIDQTSEFGVPICVLEDSQGNLWIGTQENGLFRIDRTGVKVKVYTTIDGLPSNSISGILDDANGNLWISTQQGLCKFEEAVVNPDRVRIHTYSREDGLQGSEYKRGAYCKLENGKLVFGGQNGFNVFDPEMIITNPFVPPVSITGLRLFNKEVDFRNSSILSKSVSEVDEIRLTHHESVFTIEFSALSFIHPEKNQYAYKLEGFDNTWNYVGTQHNATYSNLPAGEYTFMVRASNNDGVWNEEGTRLRIVVVPAWWEKPIVRISLLLLLALCIIGYFRYRTRSLKQSKAELERQVSLQTAGLKEANQKSHEQQEEIVRQNEVLKQSNHELEFQSSEMKRMADEINELVRAKTKLFSNISHELETPIQTLIHQLEDLLTQSNPDADQLTGRHTLMHREATRLMQLIRQMLNVGQIQSVKEELHVERKDVAQLIHTICERFKPWTSAKGIKYFIETQIEGDQFWIDELKLDKILSSLLSHSVNNASENGEVHVFASVERGVLHKDENQILRIEISNNGLNVTEEHLTVIQRIFKDGTMHDNVDGLVGFTLIKELVDFYEGGIDVQKLDNGHIIYSVQIPVTQTTDIDHKQVAKAVDSNSNTSPEPELPHILIVDEDVQYVRHKFKKILSQYHVDYASNGIDGLKLAVEHGPDLMIWNGHLSDGDADVWVRQIRNDDRISHIPVMLMLNRDEEERFRTIEALIDEIIHKPFQPDLFELKIKNIFFSRDKLKEQFLHGNLISTGEFNLSKAEEVFLQKALSIVKANIRNSDFGVDEFSEQFGMSRRSVLRKMKGVTGLSINEYIRNTRLTTSYSMLLKGEKNISEIAYAVGFTDPKYFSNCFKKLYGKLPSEIRSE